MAWSRINLVRADKDVNMEVLHSTQYDGQEYCVDKAAANAEGVQTCGTCEAALKRNEVPNFAFKNGWEFGYRDTLAQLPTLTITEITERACLSLVLPFSTLDTVRLDTSLIERFKGHKISFPSTGPSRIKKLPRTEQSVLCCSSES